MNKFLKNIKCNDDYIWGNVNNYGKQEQEKLLRIEISNKKYKNYLSEIKNHHSIPVMDCEIKKFLNKIPENGVILDIGGCWGWHWRNLNTIRPDVRVVILDLVRENLLHAKILLDELIHNKQVFLVHGNAIALEFENEIFHGVWSAQTTQHIPDFSTVCGEIYRVLRPNGIYWDYGLNNARLVRFIYKLLRKNYHLTGEIKGLYFLRRFNEEVFSIVEKIFHNKIDIFYSEIIFSPELYLPISSAYDSIFGLLDSRLTGKGWIRSLLARQCSFHIKK
jgi:ubiquinone/menaquinone biosynthesis C-methylase UbiE